MVNTGDTAMLISLFQQFENIIVLDVETTGINPKYEEIIELATIRLEKGRELSCLDADRELDVLVKLSEGRRLPSVITELTGISEQQLAMEGVSKAHACGKLSALFDCKNPLLVAYNAQFDLCFLYYFLTTSWIALGKLGVFKM